MIRILVLLVLSCSGLIYADAQKTVAIITYRVLGMAPWDPDTIKSGLVGSEEACIYMSQELAALGYKVTVFGNAPLNSSYSREDCNPRFVSYPPQTGDKFDIAVSWRMPKSAQSFRQFANKVYLWPHDVLVNDPELTNAMVDGFDDVFWLSEWQRSQWSSVHPGFSRYKNIYGNGINPLQFKPIEQRKNPYSCIYGSNYARGLEILLDIWPTVKERYPRATLDIYYGWEHWGLLLPEQEAKMRKQVVDLASSGVREHGLVGHEELNRAYEQASFWTYPCIAPETFCITALRAQLAGCVPIINEGSALKETVRSGCKSTRPEEYLAVLLATLDKAEKISLNSRIKNSQFVLEEFTWAAIAKKWNASFESSKPEVKRLELAATN